MTETCGNPLLLGWLKEWWDDAREKNSKGALTYKKAYESMRACPISFTHPIEAVQLHGLGPKLCGRLTIKLEAYCRDHGLPMPEAPSRAKKRLSNDDPSESNSTVAPSKRTRKPKPYVPTLRSGAYAIIVALSTLTETSQKAMTKDEIIALAQEHCDASFTAPSDPTKFYTAWNSMKTLQNRDLVYETGRPTRKYALTDEGWETAKRIRAVNNSDATRTAASEVQMADSGDNAEVSSFARSGVFPSNLSTSLTAAQMDNGMTNGHNVKKVSSVSSLEGVIGGSDNDTLITSDLSKIRMLRTQQSRMDGSLEDITLLQSGSTSLSRVPSKLSEVVDIDTVDVNSTNIESTYFPPESFTVELVIDNREVRAKTDQSYIQNALVSHDVVPTTRALPLGDALWIARLKPEWENKLSKEADSANGPKEIVLDHIVERKRLDDLIGSIKDGRFHEQKFRLRRSGIPNVTYVIEDITLTPEVMQRTTAMVNTAIAGTMFVDGFFVKRTRKLDDTIAYLVRVTKLLRRRYRKQGLNVVSSDALGDDRNVDRIRTMLKDERHFLTFHAFAALAGKHDSLTLRDVFLKMLMCNKGITADKALEIQRIWKTPRQFVEALENEKRDHQGSGNDQRWDEMIFRAAGQLVSCRKISKILSVRVSDVWGQE